MYGTETIRSSITMAKCWVASIPLPASAFALPRRARSRVSAVNGLAPSAVRSEHDDRLLGRRVDVRARALRCPRWSAREAAEREPAVGRDARRGRRAHPERPPRAPRPRTWWSRRRGRRRARRSRSHRAVPAAPRAEHAALPVVDGEPAAVGERRHVGARRGGSRDREAAAPRRPTRRRHGRPPPSSRSRMTCALARALDGSPR